MRRSTGRGPELPAEDPKESTRRRPSSSLWLSARQSPGGETRLLPSALSQLSRFVENLLLLSEARITPCLIFPSLAASPPIGGRAPTPPPSNACIPDTPHPRRPPRSVSAHGCLLAPPSSPDAPLPAAAASPHTRRLSPEDPGPDAAEQAGAGPGLREDSGRAW